LTPRANRGSALGQDFFDTVNTPRNPGERPSTAYERELTPSQRSAIKKGLIEEIVRNRIYGKDELNAFYKKAEVENYAVGREEMKRVWSDVLTELKAT